MGGALCADSEDRLGGHSGADRVLVAPGVAGNRRYRTVGIRVGDHTITAAHPLSSDLRDALKQIRRHGTADPAPWQTARVPNPAANWPNTTHDWSRDLDADHLQRIRREPAVFAPGGTTHLVLEVLAYAADEAALTGDTTSALTLHGDGSISVADHGGGTDTRVDSHGTAIKKPVMTTKDLRFFDAPDPVRLPDGHPRRGISVVSALSEWLLHTNRRRNGAWVQRYERGIPVSGITPIPDDGTTGTTVHFLPDLALITSTQIAVNELHRFADQFSPQLTLNITDQRT